MASILSRPQCVNEKLKWLFSPEHGPLARYAKLRVRMRRECLERFPRHRRWAIPTCMTALASRTCRDACRDRQLSVSFEIGGGGKRSRHSRRMRKLQFYVSGKRPIVRHSNVCVPSCVKVRPGQRHRHDSNNCGELHWELYDWRVADTVMQWYFSRQTFPSTPIHANVGHKTTNDIGRHLR